MDGIQRVPTPTAVSTDFVLSFALLLQGDSVIKLDISPPPAPNGVASLRRRAQDPLPPPGKLNISVVQGLKQQVCDFWSSSAAKYSHQSVRFARGWRPASIRLSVATVKSPGMALLVHG